MVAQFKQGWKNWNVAITGVNARAENPGPGCAVARCLREYSGFRGRVIGLGYDVLDAGLYNRALCHSGYLVPYPSAGQQALLERLAEVQAREQINVIVPCLDAELQNFISIRADLERMGIRMLVPTREQFVARGKDRLSGFCKSIEVLVPASKTISDSQFFDSCEEDGWQYPLIVKGIFYDAMIAHNPSEAKTVFHRMVASWGYPVLVQKLIEGDEFDLAAVADGNGGLIDAVMMRKRALTEKGKAWSGVSVWDSNIAAVAERIVRALAWSGPLEIEVIRDREGNIYLIEINPRFPSWIYLSHGVGRNLPITVLRKLAGDTNISFDEYKTGTFFIRHAQEIIVELGEFESLYMDGEISDSVKATMKSRSA
jgi:carbamoyl-phosphate synthase large subunit